MDTSCHSRLSQHHDVSGLNTQEKLSLESWGLPSSIVNGYAEKGIHQMFPWQVECLTKEGVLQGKNLVYAAPTSAGKTMVAEILMMKTVLERKKKVLFILPFVSVVREKVHYFQKLYKGVGIKVDGWMGSYSPPGGVKSVNVMIATIEKANNIINRLIEESKLDRLGCIVVDELHMLGDPGRGYLLELLLTKLRYMYHRNQDSHIQVVGMSATLPNLNVLARWLDAELYYSTFRPIPLVEHIVLDSTAYTLPDMKASFQLKSLLDLQGQSEDVLYLCLDSILNAHSVLIFCPSKNWCETLANKISSVIKKIGLGNTEMSCKIRTRLDGNALGDILHQLSQCPVGVDAALKKSISFGVGFHHAGLTMNERDIIECAFRQGTVKVLVSTSTLSSGVNLPARRVILRSPRHLDILSYKQMVGRAGRMGKDTAGESYLLCEKSEESAATALVTARLPPVQSCLGKSDISESLKRALLEVIACGIVTSLEDATLYTRCTLFSFTSKSSDSVLSCIHACIDYLRMRQFLVDSESRLIPSPLGRATLAASIPPDISLKLLAELGKARQCFVLDSELHIIYEITPYSVSEQWRELDWMKCLGLWENLPASCKRVAELVGCDRLDLLHRIQVKPAFAKTGEGRQLLSVFKRFYTALALQDIVNEMSLTQVAEKYGCNKGMLQSLQQSASTFAGMVTQFCRKLGWSGFEPLVSQFCARLEFGVQSELVSLLQIPLLNSIQARALYDAGCETLADIANASVTDILRVLQKAVPFQTKTNTGGKETGGASGEKKMFLNGEDCLTEYEAAVFIINSARSLIEQHLGVENIEWNNKNLDDSDLTYAAVTPTIRLKKSAPVDENEGSDQGNPMGPEKKESRGEVVDNSVNKVVFKHPEGHGTTSNDSESNGNNKMEEHSVEKMATEESFKRKDDSEILPSSTETHDQIMHVGNDIKADVNCYNKENSLVNKNVINASTKSKSRYSLDLFNESTEEGSHEQVVGEKEGNENDKEYKKQRIDESTRAIKEDVCGEKSKVSENPKDKNSDTNPESKGKKRLSLDLFDSSDDEVDLIEEDKSMREDLNRAFDAFDANVGGESLLEMSLRQFSSQASSAHRKTRRKSKPLRKSWKQSQETVACKLTPKRSNGTSKRKSATKNISDEDVEIWNRFRLSLSLDSNSRPSSGVSSPDVVRPVAAMSKNTIQESVDCKAPCLDSSDRSSVEVVSKLNMEINKIPQDKTSATICKGNKLDHSEQDIETVSKESNLNPPEISNKVDAQNVNMEIEDSMFDSSFPRCTLIEKAIISELKSKKSSPASSQEIFVKPKLPPLKTSKPVDKKNACPSSVQTIEKLLSLDNALLDGSFPSATLLEREILNHPNINSNEDLKKSSTNVNTEKMANLNVIITSAEVHPRCERTNENSIQNANNIVQEILTEKNKTSKIIENCPDLLQDIEDSTVIDSSISHSKPSTVLQVCLNLKEPAPRTIPVHNFAPVDSINKQNDRNPPERPPTSNPSVTHCFESQFPNISAIERGIQTKLDQNASKRNDDLDLRAESNNVNDELETNTSSDGLAAAHTLQKPSNSKCNVQSYSAEKRKANDRNDSGVLSIHSSEEIIPVNKLKSNTNPKNVKPDSAIEVSFANESDFIDDKLCCVSQSSYKKHNLGEPIRAKMNPKTKLTSRDIICENVKSKNSDKATQNAQKTQCFSNKNNVAQKTQCFSNRNNVHRLQSRDVFKEKMKTIVENPSDDCLIIESSSSDDEVYAERNHLNKYSLRTRSGSGEAVDITKLRNQDVNKNKTIPKVDEPFQKQTLTEKAVVKENIVSVSKESILNSSNLFLSKCKDLQNRSTKTPTSKSSKSDFFSCKTSKTELVSPKTSGRTEFSPESAKPKSELKSITPTQKRKSLTTKDLSSLLDMSQRFKSINETLFSISPPSPKAITPGNVSKTDLTINTTPVLRKTCAKRKSTELNSCGDKKRKLNNARPIVPINLTGIVFNDTAVSFCNVLNKGNQQMGGDSKQLNAHEKLVQTKENKTVNTEPMPGVEACEEGKHNMKTRARNRSSVTRREVKEVTVAGNESFDGTITQLEKANKYRADLVQLFKNNEETDRDKAILDELAHIENLAVSFKCVTSSQPQHEVIGTRLTRKRPKMTEKATSGESHKFRYKNKELILMYLVWNNDVAYYVDLALAESFGFKLLSSLMTNANLNIYLCHAKMTAIFLNRCCLLDVTARLVDPAVADWLICPGTEARSLRTIVKCHFKECSALCSVFGSLVNLPAEEALVLWKLRPFLESKLEQMNLWNHFIDVEMPIQIILARCELTGVGFSAAHISALNDRAARVMGALEKQMFQLGGRRFNLRSPKDWGVIKTKLSLGQGRDHPIIKIRRQWHQLDSLQTRCLHSLLFKVTTSAGIDDVTPLSTADDVISTADDVIGQQRMRIHTQFSTHSQTGRIFTLRPNLQTTPKDLTIEGELFNPRAAFGAAEGCVLICADFKQIELRVLTHLCQDSALRAAIESEDDVFRSIASKWHKIPIESVSEEKRNQTKSICYAIIYGMGPRSLASKLEISPEEAADLYSSFKRKYADIDTFCGRIIAACRQDGYVRTLGQRRRYIEDITASDNKTKAAAERQAVNTCIQGSAADIVKAAMIQTDRLLTQHESRCRLVLQIHDELIYEAPQEAVSQACVLIRQGMEHCIKLSLQLPISIKIGTTWGNAQSI